MHANAGLVSRAKVEGNAIWRRFRGSTARCPRTTTAQGSLEEN